MNFDVTTQDWQEVENLTDDTIYLMQAKTVSNGYGITAYGEANILFHQGTSVPTDNKIGQLATDVKFKKVEGVNIYIKALNTPTNIDIQEVY